MFEIVEDSEEMVLAVVLPLVAGLEEEEEEEEAPLYAFKMAS
jgi:hypothetical protein